MCSGVRAGRSKRTTTRSPSGPLPGGKAAVNAVRATAAARREEFEFERHSAGPISMPRPLPFPLPQGEADDTCKNTPPSPPRAKVADLYLRRRLAVRCAYRPGTCIRRANRRVAE